MNDQYFLFRIAGRHADLRAADADRERIATQLRKSHAEGRLDINEFQERLDGCYQAKTLGELAHLVRDLPRMDERDEHRSLGWLGTRGWRLTALAPILIALTLIAAAAGHHHVFWLWLPLVFLFWRFSWVRRSHWPPGPRRRPNDWL
jgi:hypothetical protein